MTSTSLPCTDVLVVLGVVVEVVLVVVVVVVVVIGDCSANAGTIDTIGR